MKSMSSCHYGNMGNFTHDSECPYNLWVTVKRRKDDYALFSELSNILHAEHFKQKDSMINASAITEVTKSSTKPWSSTTTNRHLHSSGWSNGEQR